MEKLCSLGKRGNSKGSFCHYCLFWARPWQRWWQIWAETPKQNEVGGTWVSPGSVTWHSVHRAKDVPRLQGKRVLRKHQQLLWAMETRSDFILKLRAEHFGQTWLQWGWVSQRPAAASLSSPSHRSRCPPYILCRYPKKEKKNSHIMLSSRSLSPLLCQSPDERSHYFKTPAGVCLSFVMSPWAAAIAVAPLIGAPTVPAACLCHTRDSSSSSSGLQADTHVCTHLDPGGSRKPAQAPLGGQCLPKICSASPPGAEVDKVSCWLYGNQCNWPPKHCSSWLPATCSNKLHQVINTSLYHLHY